MDFLKKLEKTLEIWLPDEETENYQKGVGFEHYIASIFSKQDKYFEIIDWTYDIHDKQDGIKVKSNMNPDLRIRYKPKKEEFAIECKFRSGFSRSKNSDKWVIKWAEYDQIKRYQEYSSRNKIPVFVIIGLAGTPKNPKYMFCLPLEKAKYVELYPILLKDYEREPDKLFFWRDGVLK